MTRSARATRVVLCGLWHETNTFAPHPTTLDQFERLRGEEIVSTFAGTRTAPGAFLADGPAYGWEIIPTFAAGATPSGTVAADAIGTLLAEICDRVAAARPFAALLVSLHGAMAAEDCDDVEGEVLRRLRDIAGPDIPIAATLDLHANISEAMARHADLLIGYDTYPHVDIYERAAEVAARTADMLEGKIRPTAALAHSGILSVPQGQFTDRPPMRDLLAMAHRVEEEPGVVSISVAGGFAYADVPDAGTAVLVYTDRDPQRARTIASRLAEEAWARRREFAVHNVPVEEAVQRARRAEDGPVVLVDVADNVGGGGPGDGTVILAELLRQEARGAVITIADPESVARCVAAGIGATLDLEVGGKTDPRHGPPVPVRAYVRLLCDGEFVHRGSYMTGRRFSMGRTAVVEAGGCEIVLTQRRIFPFDQEQLRSVGITPEARRILVVKAAIAWRAAYGEMTTGIIDVDTPGVCSADLGAFTFRKVRRPVFPLDQEFNT